MCLILTLILCSIENLSVLLLCLFLSRIGSSTIHYLWEGICGYTSDIELSSFFVLGSWKNDGIRDNQDFGVQKINSHDQKNWGILWFVTHALRSETKLCGRSLASSGCYFPMCPFCKPRARRWILVCSVGGWFCLAHYDHLRSAKAFVEAIHRFCVVQVLVPSEFDLYTSLVYFWNLLSSVFIFYSDRQGYQTTMNNGSGFFLPRKFPRYPALVSSSVASA
jgi:hypothetical protein